MIINGDSTLIETYKNLNKKVDFVLADPPYCLLTRRNKKTNALRDPKKSKINHSAVARFENIKLYKDFTRKWLHNVLLNTKDEAFVIIWTNFLGIESIKIVAQELGLKHFHGEFKWCKYTKESNNRNERNVRLYEVALIFSNSKKVLLKSNDKFLSDCILTTYDDEKEGVEFGNHPNHKCFSVIAPLIRNYSKVGDLILDPFCGSGSTAAAAKKLERNIFAIELKKEWYNESLKRLRS